MNLSIKLFAATAAMLALTACGATTEQACEAYVESIDTCYGDDFDSSAYSTTCSTASVNVQATTDWYVCLTAAYDAGDCSTAEGTTAIATESADCTAM